MHPEYSRAAEALQPLQLGLGAAFGMTRMAMSAQDFYAQKWKGSSRLMGRSLNGY